MSNYDETIVKPVVDRLTHQQSHIDKLAAENYDLRVRLQLFNKNAGCNVEIAELKIRVEQMRLALNQVENDNIILRSSFRERDVKPIVVVMKKEGALTYLLQTERVDQVAPGHYRVTLA